MSLKMKRKIAEEMMKRVTAIGDLSEVSVYELCRDLKISRTSFYRNFKDKYDLIDWIFKMIVVGPVNSEEHNACYYSRTLYSLQIIRQYQGFFRSILKYHGQNAFEETYFNTIASDFLNRLEQKKGKVPDSFEKSYIFFYTAGIVRLVSDWLTNGCTQTPESLTETLMRLLPEKLLEIIW